MGIRMRGDSCMGTTIPRCWRTHQGLSRGRACEASACSCVGAGGVGKTTVSAALALGLAQRGRKVAVVTIDPARRLATSLGLQELADEPRLVDPALLARRASTTEGELWAMMLDAKRTFDELITRLAPDESGARRSWPIPSIASSQRPSPGPTSSARSPSSTSSTRADFDVIVLDTPPSRNALDFLDAPGRLLGSSKGGPCRCSSPGGLDRARGRAGDRARLRRPLAGDRGRYARRAVALLPLAVGRDRRLPRARARGAALLRDPATTFLIVSSPEPEPAARRRSSRPGCAAAGMAPAS